MTIASSKAAAEYLRKRIGHNEIEEFWVVALNSMCEVLSSRMLFRGTVDACYVHPRDIFRFGLIHNASSLLVGHNHPSDVTAPSRKDIELSWRLHELGTMLQIPVVDHLIVTLFDHYSFAEKGWKRDLVTD